MKRSFFAVVFMSLLLPVFVFGQTEDQPEDKKRVRVIVSDGTAPAPSPTPSKILIISNGDKEEAPVASSATILPPPKPKSLRMGELQQSMNEAKRRMAGMPLRISMNDEEQTTEIVRVAFYDWDSKQVDYVVVLKTMFLDPNSEALVRSEAGKSLRLKTIRGNGVNTPIMLIDSSNKTHLPLIVQYPVERDGKFLEMSYYVSTHPGLVTPETVNAGRLYVRNVLNTARTKLREKGIFIQPKVADIAERLALVEHVDHWRFRNEFHGAIYNDVYMLYALNQSQTYRYSVSSAGAGGMVQMIPWTYRMLRSRYFQVGLMPDFVEGMRNHVNAAQAMLLYMQMTWNDLASNSTVYKAMENGWASQEQLMAAGYNSNPAKLAGYIRRGGSGWTRLIPRETRIYLEIFSSVEKYVPLNPRTN
ncbi:MAG: hypothetical protein R2684_17150 [Pyrinomonadaceae bacterium]